MRIYDNFQEALSEIKRDLVEMGIRIHPQTYQDKYVGDNPDFETLELQNYIYTVVNPRLEDIDVLQPWADMEFHERILGASGVPINPGEAWKARDMVWEEFIDRETGKFAYTYAERFSRHMQVQNVIKRLSEDEDSRQLFISVWDSEDSNYLGGVSRVPCSIGYLIQCRKGKINLTYLQRSADRVTHLENDMFLAFALQNFIATSVSKETGTFTHWIGSLHIFKKDSHGVF